MDPLTHAKALCDNTNLLTFRQGVVSILTECHTFEFEKRHWAHVPPFQTAYLPPTNEVWGKVIISEVCVKNSVQGGGCAIPACIAGGIPACLAAGLQKGGGGIPACLAGFQAHSQGGSLGDLASGGTGSPGPQRRGKLRVIWSRSTPKGKVEGDLTGGCLLWGEGVPALGGCLLCWEGACSGGVSAPGEVWRPPMMATAVGSMHPTGMHSCSFCV